VLSRDDCFAIGDNTLLTALHDANILKRRHYPHETPLNAIVERPSTQSATL